MEIKNVYCIGDGYVGGSTMVITPKNPDINKKRKYAWNLEYVSKLPMAMNIPQLVNKL
ncbi:hypothetical protein [Flavisericum labens]|uniref:hypothetical protein n=1 Tax=Flavisericum labens TaxID=3377112 RepID=UPI00387B99E0